MERSESKMTIADLVSARHFGEDFSIEDSILESCVNSENQHSPSPNELVLRLIEDVQELKKQNDVLQLYIAGRMPPPPGGTTIYSSGGQYDLLVYRPDSSENVVITHLPARGEKK